MNCQIDDDCPGSRVCYEYMPWSNLTYACDCNFRYGISGENCDIYTAPWYFSVTSSSLSLLVSMVMLPFGVWGATKLIILFLRDRKLGNGFHVALLQALVLCTQIVSVPWKTTNLLSTTNAKETGEYANALNEKYSPYGLTARWWGILMLSLTCVTVSFVPYSWFDMARRIRGPTYKPKTGLFLLCAFLITALFALSTPIALSLGDLSVVLCCFIPFSVFLIVTLLLSSVKINRALDKTLLGTDIVEDETLVREGNGKNWFKKRLFCRSRYHCNTRSIEWKSDRLRLAIRRFTFHCSAALIIAFSGAMMTVYVYNVKFHPQSWKRLVRPGKITLVQLSYHVYSWGLMYLIIMLTYFSHRCTKKFLKTRNSHDDGRVSEDRGSAAPASEDDDIDLTSFKMQV